MLRIHVIYMHSFENRSKSDQDRCFHGPGFELAQFSYRNMPIIVIVLHLRETVELLEEQQFKKPELL